MANQVDFKILPSDQFNVYSPQNRSEKVITYFTLLSKLRGDILSVSAEDDPNDIVSAYYSNTGGTQTLHLVKADGSEVTASQPQQIISGTVNYISKFTTSNDIGNSQVFDDGTNVGIGTTTMTHKLQLGTGGVFADYYQLDTTYSNGFVVGALSWDIDNGTMDVGLSSNLKLKVGQDDVWYVKNQTGSSIAKGTAVYASGTLGASSKILISPMIANGTIPAKFFLGIVAETIANGAEGYVLTKGKLRNINTSAYNEGDVLWVSPTTAGALTATEPTAPNLKLPVAFVVNKGNNGVLAIRATTGQRIADASDVDYAGASDNSFLVYNSSTGVWEDESVGIFKTIAVSGQSDVVADTYTDTLTLVAGTNVTITTNASTDSITINSTDQYVGTVTSVATTAPITGGTITTTGTIGITQSGASSDGYLSSTDWNTFNNKQGSLTFTAPLVNTSGTVTITQASASANGYLSSTDWNTFNNKASDAFKTIAVAGQSNVVADSATDTLTFEAGTNIVITTDAATDKVIISAVGGGTGSVTSVDMSVPTGFAISGNPITTSGTLALAFASGYSLPTNASQGNWDTAYNNSITAFAYNTSTGVLTLTQQDAGTLTATVTLQPFSTTNLTEGTNLYFTTTRARQSLSAGTGISYDNSTGVITNSAPDQIVSLTAGTGISTSGTYPSFTITNTAPDQTVVLTAGTGITTSGTYPNFTITNSDRGSSQNIFKNIAVSGQSTIIADSNDDTLTVASGTGISLATNATSDTLTITNTAPDQTVVLNAGTGISTSGTYPNFTITNTLPDQTVVLTGAGTTVVTGTYPSFTITSNDQYVGTVTSVATTAPITGGTITSTGTIGITQSGTASDGYLSSTDWNTFNAKIGGSGTTNYVAKFTGSSAIGNSSIYDNGNVGIGTTNPIGKLTVKETDTSWELNTDADAVYQLAYNRTTSAYKIMWLRASSFVFAPNDLEKVRITSDGNVGIGNTAPNQKLEISVGNAVTGGLRINYASSATGEGMDITYLNTGNTTTSFDSRYNSDSAVMQFRMKTAATAVNAMTILGSGNVGINSTAPDAKLRVEGLVAVNGEGNGVLVDTNPSSSARVGLMKYGGYEGMLVAGSATLLRLAHRTDSTAVYGGTPTIREDLVITAAGDVGIGTAAPGFKLTLAAASATDSDIFLAGMTGVSNGFTVRRVSSSFVYSMIDGGLGINNAAPTQALHVTGSARVTGAYYDSNNSAGTSDQILTSTATGTDWKSKSELSLVDGSGTANYVSKWSDTDTLTDSIIYDSGTNVGIGTALPGAKLQVGGALKLTGGDWPTGYAGLELNYVTNTSYIGSYDRTNSVYKNLFLFANDITLETNASIRMYIATGGNVGINTTSPGYRLDVTGGSTTSRRGFSSPRFSSTGEYNYGVTNSPTWNINNGSYTNNNTTSPDGTTTAGTYTLTTSTWDLYQTIAVTSGVEYTVGAWVKLGTATNFCIVINNTISWNTVGGKAFDSSDGLSTSKWTHISFTFTGPASGNVNLHIGAHSESGVPQQTAGTVFLWNWEMSLLSSTWIGKVDDEIRLPGSSIWTSRGNVGIANTSAPINLYVGSVLTGTNGNGTYASDAIAVNSSESITIGPDRRADWTLNAATATSTTFQSKLNIWSDNEDHITFGGASTHLVSAWESFKIWINNDSADAGTLHLYHTSSKTEFVRFAGSGNSWINGGNVGIGTTAPGAKLEVDGTWKLGDISGGSFKSYTYGTQLDVSGLTAGGWARSNKITTSDTSGNVFFGVFGSDTTLTRAYWTIGDPASIDTTGYNSGNGIILLKNGNVGIGTTVPGAQLELAKTTTWGTLTNEVIYINNSGTGGDVNAPHNMGSITWRSGNVNTAAISAIRNTPASGNNVELRFTTSSAGVQGERMTITNIGNVGIGTTNPTSKLYIEGGSANWNETTPGLSVGTIHLDPGADTNDFGNAITFGASDASSGTDAQAGIYLRSDGNYGTKMYFATTDSYAAGSKTRMFIGHDGNVGIGTTAPAQKLEVNGNIKLSSTAGSTATPSFIWLGNDFSNGTTRDKLKIYLYNSGTEQYGFSVGSIGDVQYHSNTIHDFYVSNGNALRINGSSQVGIGSTSMFHSAKLSIAGLTHFQAIANGDIGGAINGFWTQGVNGTNYYAGGLKFYYFDNVGAGYTLQQGMILDGQGNFGIRVAEPSSTLHISTTGANAYSSTITNGVNMKGITNTLSNNADDMVGIYFGTGTNAGGSHWSGITGSRSNSAVDWGTQLNFYTHDENTSSITTATQKMVIKGSGDVGIGTTTPSAGFGGTISNVKLALRNGTVGASGGTSVLLIGGDNNHYSSITAEHTGGGDTYLSFGTSTGAVNPSEKMRITAGGNVGIGTTAPKQKLIVEGTLATKPSGVDGYYSYLRSNWAENNAFELGISEDGASNFHKLITSSDYYFGSTLQFWTSDTEKMRITSGGNVGIGNTSPNGALSFADDVRTRKIVLWDGAANNDYQFYGFGVESSTMIQSIYGSGDRFLWTVGTGTATRNELMVLNSDGKVGIGTTAPTYGLVVANQSTANSATGTMYIGAVLNGSGKGLVIDSATRTTGDNAVLALEIINRAGGNTMAATVAGNVGIGTPGPVTKLEVYGGHDDTTARLYSIGNGSGLDASLDMWASEPGVTYDGSGIGNNVNKHPYYGRRNTGLAQSYIRFFGGGILLNTGSTTASQTVTVLASGNVGINNTNPSYKLDVTGDVRVNTGALGVNVAPSATDGRIDASNDIVAFSSSDLRLKENVKPIENALDKVKSLTGVEFDWKPELKHAHGYEGHDTGVIAQEVQEVMPTAIRTNDTGYLAVRYEKLIGLLIEANKELAARVEELESKLK